MSNFDPLFSVADRVVILTGGMGQLGRSFATALAERGAKVAVIDRKIDRDQASALLPEVNRLGLFIEADVTQRASLESALRTIEEHLGPPDVLINNAALDSPPGAPASENGPFEDYPESSFDKVMEVNVKGVVLCCQVFGSAMAKQHRGSIINISSIYGVLSPDQNLYGYRRERGDIFYKPVAYSVSKSAILNLTRYLATYWAPQKIRVNTLTFAGVFNHQDPEFLERYLPKVPLGRMASAEDYRGAVLYLSSDASAYVTGANLVIDGGFTAI